MDQPPSSILILGHGVFGLSTALSLTLRPAFKNTTITLLDRSPFPSPDGSSIDTSRIIRSDYSDPLYARLGAEAMTIWRSSSTSPLPSKTYGEVANILSGLGEQGRYTQSGLALLCNDNAQGSEYVRNSFQNMKEMSSSQDVHELASHHEIAKLIGTGGKVGDWGYLNKSSGWADAEACMLFLHQKILSINRVKFITGEATSLIHSPAPMSGEKQRIEGVLLSTGQRIFADLTIVATGAWTGSLVDLRGRATATGQALTYLPISTSEQRKLSKMPVVLNMSTGMFIIPPPSPSPSSSASTRSQKILKVARHGYGYTNPTPISSTNLTFSSPQEKTHAKNEITISLPRTTYNDPTLHVPLEGQNECRNFLSQVIPSLIPASLSTSSSTTPHYIPPFNHSKICWYNDTPTGDFLICHQPSYTGLFLATGGSGHGFKFLPVIGERIVDVLMKDGKGWVDFGEGGGEGEGKGKWGWREKAGEDQVVTEDGSRGGGKGMVLDVELAKGVEIEKGRRESRL